MVTLWKRIPKKKDGKPVINERGKPEMIMFLRHYTVFNIEQTVGLEDRYVDLSPQAVPWDQGDLCRDVIDHFPEPKPSFEGMHGSAWYRPSDDTVGMPRESAFDSGDDYYSTLYHEYVHSTGHKDRLAREGIMERNVFGDVDYSREELVAEFGAAMLCAEAGIFGTKRVEQTAAYIDHWRQRIGEDKKMLVQAGAQAQKAVDYVIGRTFEDSPASTTEAVAA
jgi:antirestriction protein ArdC